MNVLDCLVLLLLPSLGLILPSCCDKGAFSYVLSVPAVDPVYGVRLDSTVPAVDLALDYINTNSTLLLPSVNLTYGEIGMLTCPAQDGMLEDVVDDADVGVLGYSCSEVSTSSLGVFNFTPMIQYTPVSADILFSDSDIVDQPALFTIHPTPRTYAAALVSIIEQFGWHRFLAISDLTGHRFFTEVLGNIATSVRSANITLLESDTNSTAPETIIPQDVRIIFLNVDFSKSVEIMCEAYRSGFEFPRYVWIAYNGDYTGLSVTTTLCSSSQLAQFLEGVFTLVPFAGGEAVSEDVLEVVRAIQNTQDFSRLSYFAFDAILVLAQAVNDTLAGWSNNSPDWSFCEVESELNKTSLTKCFVRQKILNINVTGVTGPIWFDSRGQRVVNVIELQQYRVQGDEVIPSRELVAQVTVDSNAALANFEFISGENETTLFDGPVPPDGTPIKRITNQPLPFVIVYYVFASVGIAYALVCLLFNILFRNRKIVKLISPNLNYFVATGAILLYGLVYVRILPLQTELAGYIRCNLQIFLVCVGYVLCFAPVLMKMLRVYYIFHNPSPTKKTFKDWHLVLGTVILTGTITLVVVVGIAVPVFRGMPQPIRDAERPEGITEDGIRIENCINQCYGFDLPLVWIALEYVFLLSLQVAAFILAIMIRNVKIKVLNDSKEMMVIVYSSTTIMLILGVFTFALGTKFVLNEILFCGLVMLATTIFLTFLFVPKMVYLYKDPRGEGIFGKTTDNSTSANQYKSDMTHATQSGNLEFESSTKGLASSLKL